MLSRSVGSAAMTPASCVLMTCTFSPFFLGEPRSMFIHFIDLSKPPAFDFIDFLYGFPIFDFIDFSSRFYDFSFWLPRARVALLSPASRGGSFCCSFWIFVIFQDTRSALWLSFQAFLLHAAYLSNFHSSCQYFPCIHKCILISIVGKQQKTLLFKPDFPSSYLL